VGAIHHHLYDCFSGKLATRKRHRESVIGAPQYRESVIGEGQYREGYHRGGKYRERQYCGRLKARVYLETRIPIWTHDTLYGTLCIIAGRWGRRQVRRVIGRQTFYHVLLQRVRALAGHARDTAHTGRVNLQCVPG
jgi:hypothetical protein